MHRPLVTITFVLFATLVQPRAADAGFWAWLEKWSGPGPFRARPYETLIVTFCGQDRPANRADAATVDRVMAWQKEWRFKPSPIAMADTFHQAQQAISRRLAAIRTQVPQPAAATQMPEAPVTDRDFLALLLENPSVTSLGYAAPVILPTAQTPAEPQVEPSPGEAARITPLERRLLAAYAQRVTQFGPGHEHKRYVCGYFDFGSFVSDEDIERGFPALRATLVDAGPSARVHDGVDIGGGLGRVFFRGTGVSTSRATFTPLRIVLRPIVIAVPEKWRHQWMGLLSFYWKETYVWGQLTGADFGAPDNPWSENGELIRSFGFTLDFTAIVPAVAKRFRD